MRLEKSEYLLAAVNRGLLVIADLVALIHLAGNLEIERMNRVGIDHYAVFGTARLDRLTISGGCPVIERSTEDQ